MADDADYFKPCIPGNETAELRKLPTSDQSVFDADLFLKSSRLSPNSTAIKKRRPKRCREQRENGAHAIVPSEWLFKESVRLDKYRRRIEAARLLFGVQMQLVVQKGRDLHFKWFQTGDQFAHPAANRTISGSSGDS